MLLVLTTSLQSTFMCVSLMLCSHTVDNPRVCVLLERKVCQEYCTSDVLRETQAQHSQSLMMSLPGCVCVAVCFCVLLFILSV